MMPYLRTLCALLAAAAAPTLAAIESETLLVQQVIDGDTIAVTQALGPVRVRLLYLDTPESRTNAHGAAMPEGTAATAHLAQLLPPGSHVRLVAAGETFERDRYERLLAVVYPVGAATSAQEHQIAAGWSVYWRKYGQATDPLHRRLIIAEQTAAEQQRGAWATVPQWMRDKRNERTAPSQRAATGAPPADSPPVPASEPPAAAATHWLNTRSGVRHNQRCRHYRSTTAGAPCGPNDGRACGNCGG
jgi:endonuclease YncB( thermonuclease family)